MSYQSILSFVTPGRYFVNFKRKFHIHRILYGTHYDTLKLPRNCTPKEVRDSFIKLSKQCHPDRNRSDPNTHAKFVKLNEAYSVLSRPDKKRAYDLTLKPLSSERYHRPSEGSPFDVYTTAYRQKVVWRDESFWEYKDKNEYGDFSQSGDYYGIRGIKRVPNGWIAIMCVVFAAVGIWLQILLIKYSTTFNRQALDERSQETSRVLSDVQEKAQRHGNKVQLELLKRRFDTTQNASDGTSVPSVKDENKSTTGNKNSCPYNADDSSTVVIRDTEYYSKTSLGYLGDMPHRVGNDVQPIPEVKLHNISRNEGIENYENSQILTKPILFNMPYAENEVKMTGINYSSTVLSTLSNDTYRRRNEIFNEENLSELIFCDYSDSVGKEKKGIKVTKHEKKTVREE